MRGIWPLLALAALLTLVWMWRYEFWPLNQKGGAVYVLDRWTGKIVLYNGEWDLDPDVIQDSY